MYARYSVRAHDGIMTLSSACIAFAPAAHADGLLKAGARVQAQGLVSDEGRKLNGSVGSIVSWNPADGRYRVQLDGEFQRVKGENLMPLL
jgi:hypothetical protein